MNWLGLQFPALLPERFEGHFPDNPIVPGVVIVEAMAQTAGVVVSENLINKNDQSVLFMSINKAKFRKPVLPNYKIKFSHYFEINMASIQKIDPKVLKKIKKQITTVDDKDIPVNITSGQKLRSDIRTNLISLPNTT